MHNKTMQWKGFGWKSTPESTTLWKHV